MSDDVGIRAGTMTEDELDIDARITDNLMLADMAETSLSISTHKADELSMYYDQAEMTFWNRWADFWHRQKYDRHLDRAEWRERFGV